MNQKDNSKKFAPECSDSNAMRNHHVYKFYSIQNGLYIFKDEEGNYLIPDHDIGREAFEKNQPLLGSRFNNSLWLKQNHEKICNCPDNFICPIGNVTRHSEICRKEEADCRKTTRKRKKWFAKKQLPRMPSLPENEIIFDCYAPNGDKVNNGETIGMPNNDYITPYINFKNGVADPKATITGFFVKVSDNLVIGKQIEITIDDEIFGGPCTIKTNFLTFDSFDIGNNALFRAKLTLNVILHLIEKPFEIESITVINVLKGDVNINHYLKNNKPFFEYETIRKYNK